MLLLRQVNIKLDKRVRDYLPDPPTPINIAHPLGYLNILAILKTCSIASSKNISLA